MSTNSSSNGPREGENAPTSVPPSPAPAPSLMASLMASASAGMLARIPCHPMDTIKARLQVQTEAAGGGRYRNLLDAGRQIARAEGFRGLYRGFPITFWGSAPGTMLYLTTYDVAKGWSVPLVSSHLGTGTSAEAVGQFTAGLIAEAVSCLFWVPIDVIKERMQIQSVPSSAVPRGAPLGYTNTRSAIATIMKGEGLRGLYRGYGATLASFGPFSALYFMFYERIKAATLSVQGGSALSFGWGIVTASLAGSAASLLSNPLDLVKLRLQVQRGAAASATDAAGGGGVPFQYRGMAHALASIIKQEGPAALFKGAGARIAFHAPSTALTMAFYEQIKSSLA